MKRVMIGHIREGSVDIIQLLLDMDAELWCTVSHNGRTPLHTASLHGRVDAVNILLSRGAYQRDERDCCGTTPLMDALRAGYVDIATALIHRHSCSSAVCIRITSVREHIQIEQADINLVDSMGRHALHLAAEANSASAVQFLVTNCGASVNLPTTVTHDAPVHFAAKEGHTSMAAQLLSLGADVHFTNKNKRSGIDRQLVHKINAGK